MARHKEGGLDVVASLPWPFGVGMGVLVFLAVRYGGLVFAHSANPILAAFGNAAGNGLLTPVAWLMMITCWVAAAASYKKSRDRARLLETTRSLDAISAIEWHEFEVLVGEVFRRQGYQVEESGGRGADGGIDLVLRRSGTIELVQCKQWRTRQVKVNVVREMWGVAQHHNAAAVRIVCVGEFTRDAAAFAKGKPIELINGATLVALIEKARSTTDPRPPNVKNTGVPNCPRCSAPMQSRRNKGTRQPFWGCTHFPQCKGTRPVESTS